MTLDGGTGTCLFASSVGQRLFRRPVETVSARSTEEVLGCFEHLSKAVDGGLHVAGFLTYESAPAFDSALATHSPTPGLPLLWFGVFEEAVELDAECPSVPADFLVEPWEWGLERDDYLRRVQLIREYTAAGDTYQVNYCFPLSTQFQGDPQAWFVQLCRAQGSDHCAFVETDRHCILSASPELFFRLDGEALTTRPMKGTRPRGRWRTEDEAAAAALRSSAKERAENVMIVDMLRNDMGRISAPGSVNVDRLFSIERYETVWQMTSTITSRTGASVPDIFRALFPSGSVTGAPKVRTMEIIRKLEPSPRGVYCGAVGWWSPGRRAEFNVAIRTVTIDKKTGGACAGVGGGITWASDPEAEYQECEAKTAFLTRRRPAFELLESLLFDESYFLLKEHLDRLRESAAYFGFAVDLDAVEKALHDEAKTLDSRVASEGPFKVRVLAARGGAIAVMSAPAAAVREVRVGPAREPVDDQDVFLFHKTTAREVYERARASRPDCDDVLLWNQRGELTESTSANVVVDLGDGLVTPPVACGLLAGTMRRSLLEHGEIREAVVKVEDLASARAIHLINSVRKWIPVRYVS